MTDACALSASISTASFWLVLVAIITTQLAVEDAIHERAFGETNARLSPDESEAEFKWEWKSVPSKRPGGLRAKELVQRPDRYYSQFEGRTFNQECERLEALYLASDPPVITERFETDRGYAYGIGLHAVDAEVNLDRAAIERTIQRFRDCGERDWQGI